MATFQACVKTHAGARKKTVVSHVEKIMKTYGDTVNKTDNQTHKESIREAIDELKGMRDFILKGVEKIHGKPTIPMSSIVPTGRASVVNRSGKVDEVTYPIGSWIQTSVGGVSIYLNGNAIIIKKGSGKWGAYQKGKDGERVEFGTYESLEKAKAAFAGETVAEKEVKKIGRPKENTPKLTPEQGSLITEDLIEKVENTVFKNKNFSHLRNDPEVKGLIAEAIVKAAAQFNKEGNTTFLTYAANKGKGAVLDYLGSKTNEVQFVDTTDGSGINIEQITQADTQRVPTKTKEQKNTEHEPSKVKILDPNSVYSPQEQQAMIDKFNKDKQKQKGKGKNKVQKYLDENPDEGKESFVDEEEGDLVESFNSDDDFIEELVLALLEDNKGDIELTKAQVEASPVYPTDLKNEILEYLKPFKTRTIETVLEKLKNDKNKGFKELANLFSHLISNTDRKNVKVLFDEDSITSKYNIKKDVITLNEHNGGTKLHEISHALTARALRNNKALRQNVLDVIAEIEEHLINNKDIKITKELIADMRAATPNRSSKEFREWLENKPELGKGEKALLYSILNEFEFLTTFINHDYVRDVYSNIELSEKVYASPLKTAYNWLIDTYLKIIGATKIKRNAVAKALNLLSELSQLDATFETNKLTSNQEIEVQNLSTETEGRHQKTYQEQLKVLQSHDTKGKPVDITKAFVKQIVGTTTDFLSGVTDELRKIRPSLLRFVRRFEYNISKYNVKYHDAIKPFIEKYRKLDRIDQLALDHLLRNGDTPEDVVRAKELLAANNMTKEYQKVVEVLKDIHRRKDLVGLNEYGEVDYYFPRGVKDLLGLMQAMKDDPNYGVITAAMEKVGTSRADREKAIMQLVNTGRSPLHALLKPGSSKERTIIRVSSEWNHYYHNSIDALINHIYESNEAIEARNMFGDVKRRGLVSQRNRLSKEIELLKENDDESKTLEKKAAELIHILDKLKDYDKEWREGISNLLYKEGLASKNREGLTEEQKKNLLTAEEQEKVVVLIRARLTNRGMGGVLGEVRNLALMSTMASFTSALNQLVDVIVSVNDNGVKNTLKAMFGDNIVSTEDLDLSNSMREFQSSGSARLLNKLFTKTGLIKLDRFGKNTYMNSSVLKVRDAHKANPTKAKEDFIKKWSDALGDKVAETFDDIVEGKKNDNTEFFAFTSLSDVQPISLSEMPLKYLQYKDGKIFYTLKAFQIKQLNVVYRRLVTNTKNATTKAERLESLKDAGKLIILLALAGASMDELKDFILGREVEFSDNVAGNLMKIVMLNRHTITSGAKGDMFKSLLADTLIPPTRFLSDPYSDLLNWISAEPNTFKTVRNLPFVGNVVHSRFTKTGQKSNYRIIHKDIHDRYNETGSVSSVRDDMAKYNKWAREADEPLISYQSLRQSKKRKEKKEKEKK